MRKKDEDFTTMSIPKSVVLLAWPVILRMALQMIVGVVDLAFVGRVHTAATASVGLSNTLMWFIISATTAFSVGTTTIVAQNIGAKNYKRAEKVSLQSVAITFSVAAIIGILSSIFSRQIIQLMIMRMDTPDPTVLKMGTQYFRIMSFSFPFFFTLMVLNGIFQGAGDMKTPLKINAFVNIFNIIFDWLLIFGVGPFPELGIMGAAIATSTARILAFGGGMFILATGRTRKIRIHWPEKFSFDWETIKQVTDVGIPAAAEQLIRNSGSMLITVIVSGMGTLALAAHPIVMRGMSIAFMPAIGFNLAATTLVGQNLGADQPERAEKTGYVAAGMSSVFMTVLGIAIFIFANPISRFFTPNPEVIKLAVTGLRIVSVSLPFLGILLTFFGSLRGAGDTKWVMYITAVGVWGLRVAMAYLFGVIFGLGFTGVWIAFAMDFIGRMIMSFIRYRSGKWKDIKVRKTKKATS